MWKWILGFIALIVMLAGLVFATVIWLGMAQGLQQMVEDNLTYLRKEVIFEDRDLDFDYVALGVEMIGLKPAVTIEQPRLLIKQGKTEYRLTAPELSIIGSFSQLTEVELAVPKQTQLTRIRQGEPPQIRQILFKNPLSLTLLSEGGEDNRWERYRLPSNEKGVLEIRDAKAQKILMPIPYSTNKETLAQPVQFPYSPKILPLLRKFLAPRATL